MDTSSRGLRLLPESALLKTGPVDHADWNYSALFGPVQRLRFRLIRKLLQGRRFERLLEIGYGSGIFMPELARYAEHLYGIDPHEMAAEVAAVLAEHGVQASLVSGTVESLPFEDGMFDCAVSVSAFEYVEDLDRACAELTRVLRPGGTLVIATPGASPIWDSALRFLARENPEQYGDRRQRLLPTLKSHFALERELKVPPLGGRLFRLYTGVALKRR